MESIPERLRQSYFSLDRKKLEKNLGTEVLSFTGRSTIFNFSEKLSQTIDPDIAQTTLEQAMHSIPADSGILVLWNDETGQLEIPAASEKLLFSKERIKKNVSLLFKIGFSGQSEIINDISALKEKGIVEESVRSLMYAAMKVKHRIMGAITWQSEISTAANLKLLVTLALQSFGYRKCYAFYKKYYRSQEREEAILRIHEVTKNL
jgi:hypothetical protein